MNNTIRIAALSALALTALAFAHPAHAQVIASDSFNVPGYTAGGLNGQAVQGTGFKGNWAQALNTDLTVLSTGVIGRPAPQGGQAGDVASFAGNGFSVTTGQLYISYDINNPNASLLTATRLQLGTTLGGQSALLGATGSTGANLNFVTNGGFGSSAVAQTGIASVGAHHLVGVLDFSNSQIAIFVDPTATSFYNANGTSSANAATAWTPPTSYTATNYGLVDNLNDQATFDNVVFSTSAASAGVGTAAVTPEPGSVALLIGLGVTGAGFLARKRRK